MRRRKGRTQAGAGISVLQGRFSMRRTESFDENMQRKKSYEKANKTLKYGGSGIGRRLAYGATSSLLGEGVTSRLFTGVLGNKDQQESAYRTISEGARGSNQSMIMNSIKLIRVRLDDLETTVSENSQKMDNILQLSQEIYENTLDKRKQKRRAGKGELSVIPKATLLSAQPIEQAAPLEKLNSNSKVLSAIFMEIANLKSQNRGGYQESMPATFKEYKQQEKDKAKAERAMKVGGYGIGRRMMYGMTKSVIGERGASWLARKGASSKDMQKAYEVLTPNRRRFDSFSGVAESTTGVSSSPALTATQQGALSERKSFVQGEKIENEMEWREKVIDMLEDLQKKCNNDGGSGMIGMVLAGVSSAIAGISAGIATISTTIATVATAIGLISGTVAAISAGVTSLLGAGGLIAGYGLVRGQQASDASELEIKNVQQLLSNFDSATNDQQRGTIVEDIKNRRKESIALASEVGANMDTGINATIARAQEAERKVDDAIKQHFRNRGVDGEAALESIKQGKIPEQIGEGAEPIQIPDRNFLPLETPVPQRRPDLDIGDPNNPNPGYTLPNPDTLPNGPPLSSIPVLENAPAQVTVVNNNISQGAPTIVGGGNSGGSTPSAIFARDPSDPVVRHDLWLSDAARTA